MRNIRVWECVEIPQQIVITTREIPVDFEIKGRWAKEDIGSDKNYVVEAMGYRSWFLIF